MSTQTTATENGIRMVCFDAGGVLVRICRSWEEGCRAAGVEVRAREESEHASARRRELNAAYQSGRISPEEFFDSLAETSAGAYTPDEVRRVHDAWILDEYPGVRELVAQIHAADRLTTAVLSNTNASHWELMGPRRDMIVLRVHHPHASHLLGHVKPDEAVFRAFEHATGFAPHEILLFDDLEENIRGAADAGWHTRLVDHAGDTAAQMRAHLQGLRLL